MHPFWRKNKTVIILMAGVVCIKLLLLLWGYGTFDFKIHSHDTWLSIWNRWDANVYTTIATQGYSPQDLKPDYFQFLAHFPPLYPVLIAIASWFPLSHIQAAFAIGWAASLAASYFLYQLVEQKYDFKIAVLAVLFFNLSPVSYFMIAPYSEALFILCIVLSFFFLQKKNYTLAGLLGGGAILTRLIGVTLIPAYAYVLIRNLRRNQFTFRQLWLMALPLVGFGIFLAINWYIYGSPFYFIREIASNPYSAKSFSFPFRETINAFSQVPERFHDSFFMMTLGWGSLLTVAALGLTILGIVQKIPWEYTIFSFSYIAFYASLTWGISNARFTLPIVPLYLVLAKIKKRYLIKITFLISILLLLYFSKIFTGGSWAF